MNTRDLMNLCVEPFRSRTDYMLELMNGENGVREAIAATVLEYFCTTCSSWQEVNHVECPGRKRDRT